jgi:hypothetical protein
MQLKNSYQNELRQTCSMAHSPRKKRTIMPDNRRTLSWKTGRCASSAASSQKLPRTRLLLLSWLPESTVNLSQPLLSLLPHRSFLSRELFVIIFQFNYSPECANLGYYASKKAHKPNNKGNDTSSVQL